MDTCSILCCNNSLIHLFTTPQSVEWFHECVVNVCIQYHELYQLTKGTNPCLYVWTNPIQIKFSLNIRYMYRLRIHKNLAFYYIYFTQLDRYGQYAVSIHIMTFISDIKRVVYSLYTQINVITRTNEQLYWCLQKQAFWCQWS